MANTNDNKKVSELIAGKCNQVIDLIAFEGLPLRKALVSVALNYQDWKRWLDESEDHLTQYACACDERAELLFDKVIEIAEDDKDDEKPFVGINHVHRDKLKIDTYKWYLSKIKPKKYGDRQEVVNTNINHNSVPLERDEIDEISRQLNDEY